MSLFGFMFLESSCPLCQAVDWTNKTYECHLGLLGYGKRISRVRIYHLKTGNCGRQRKEAKISLFATMFFQPYSPLCEEVDLTNKAFDYGVRIVQITK